MLLDQDAVVVHLQDGGDLNDYQGAEHFQVSEVAVQPTETSATDDDDLCSAAVSIGCSEHWPAPPRGEYEDKEEKHL